MTATVKQSGGILLGDNISGESDDTSFYCIFSVINGGWRKNVAVHVATCETGKVGYTSTSDSTWTDITDWFGPGAYYVENLTGCPLPTTGFFFHFYILTKSGKFFRKMFILMLKK